jgi:catechol-2,3-dioxygenase
MLGNHPIGPVLLAKDLGRSREFYAGKLGLTVLDEDESAITYASGGTRLTVTASTTGTSDEQTQASWQVEDLRSELDQLKASGVEPEEYDNDDITTVDGIADRGKVWSAWIIDPDGNALGIEQAK